MTLWSIFRSPLMIGGEMTGFDDFTMKILTNEGILRMHKNSRNAHQVFRRNIGGVEFATWIAQDVEGGTYIAIFNLGNEEATLKASLEEFEIYDKVEATELWSGDAAMFDGEIKVTLPAHGAKAYRF